MTVAKYEKGTGAVKKKAAPKRPKTKKVRFLISPTGLYNLAYSAGQVATLPTKKADEIIKAGHGEIA